MWLAESGWGLMLRARLQHCGGRCDEPPGHHVLGGAAPSPSCWECGLLRAHSCLLLWELPSVEGSCLPQGSFSPLPRGNLHPKTGQLEDTKGQPPCLDLGQPASRTDISIALHGRSAPPPGHSLTSLHPVLIPQTPSVSFLYTNLRLRVCAGNPA